MDPSAESLLRDGRQAYASKRFKQAARCFTLAMKRCPCAKGLKRERCQCKNFTHAAETNTSIFHEALNTCSCSVGQTFDNCDNTIHIQALDYRAATFESLKELERARKDAEWMLEIAPRCSDGYLRLGKISRLEKRNRFAWKVFNAGIEASISAGLSKIDPKMEKLYEARRPLHARYFRQDPLQLPLDLVHMIFAYLDLSDRMTCLRVCKPWRTSLTGPANRHLWRTFECRQRGRRRVPLPPSRVIKKFFGWSGNDVRQIVIEDLSGVSDLDQWLERLMRGAPKLNRLELLSGATAHQIQKSLSYSRWPRSLSQLILGDPISANWLKYWEKNDFANLDHLELSCLEGFILPDYWPNVRYLSIKGRTIFWNFDTFSVPRLEQLRISAATLVDASTLNTSLDSDDEDQPGFNDEDKPASSRLRALVFQGSDPNAPANARTDAPVTAYVLHRLCSIYSGEGLLHMDLAMDVESFGRLALGHSYDTRQFHEQWVNHQLDTTTPEPNKFPDLRELRLHGMPSDPEAARAVLACPLESGSLRAFDINFETLGLNARGQTHVDYLEGFSWLKDALSIQALGIRNFFLEVYSLEQQQALVTFLGSFPNLGTLEIESHHYTPLQLSLLILEIMKAAKLLKVVYASGLAGAALDNLRAEAHTNFGVEVVPGRKPKQWPVPLEED